MDRYTLQTIINGLSMALGGSNNEDERQGAIRAAVQVRDALKANGAIPANGPISEVNFMKLIGAPEITY